MLVVVGGHSRNIGKTSVVAALIRALPEFGWTAMKITQFGHGICSSAGTACDCAPKNLQHPYVISEEHHPGDSDSGRFLAAGAVRSYWLRAAVGQLGNAVPAIREILRSSENFIAESNSLLQFFRPDLYLVVMDFAKRDFKPSSLRYLDRADALLVLDSGINVPLWDNVARGLWDRKPRFVIRAPFYITPALTAFVRDRVSSGSSVCAGAAAERFSKA